MYEQIQKENILMNVSSLWKLVENHANVII